MPNLEFAFQVFRLSVGDLREQAPEGALPSCLQEYAATGLIQAVLSLNVSARPFSSSVAARYGSHLLFPCLLVEVER